MPFYSKLKIGKSTSAADKKKRKRVSSKLIQLRSALDEHFQASGAAGDSSQSVKIATWNLREFGAGKYSGRSYESLYYMSEIISSFQIVALQEVRSDMKEFKKMLQILGPDWDYVASDVTDGSAGNGERMVFLYNQRRVQFRNVAGELTLEEGAKIRAAFGERIKLEEGLEVELPANVDLSGTYDARIKTVSGKKKLNADLEIALPENARLVIPEGTKLVVKKNSVVTSPSKGKATVAIPDKVSGKEFGLKFPENTFDDSLRQFARTPYLISFQCGWLKLNLCTVHIYYGDSSLKSKLEQRRSEIEQLTKALADKAKSEFKFDDKSFLGVLGDFNIVGKDHPTMEALESNGFIVPEELKSIPGSNVARDKAYDQIAFWKPSRIQEYARLDINGANVFDFYEHVFKLSEEDIYRGERGNGLKPSSSFKTWRTYKMSDHLPMWIELRTDFSKEYLESIGEE